MTIAEFLLKLATDDELLRQFRDEPGEVLRFEPDLDAKQRNLLLAGSLIDLRVKIKAEFEVNGEKIAMITIYVPPPPPPT